MITTGMAALPRILNSMGTIWPGPTEEQRQNAPEHVAWEYVALLAAAQQVAAGYGPPLNHQVQEAFLVHLRNLAEFFHKGVAQFRRNPEVPPQRNRDNIYAVDLCSSVTWDESPFDPSTRLRRAIDKTLSHMTYSRDLKSGSSEITVAFDSQLHLHGTLVQVRRTWEAFVRALHPQYRNGLMQWLDKFAGDMGVSLNGFYADFDERAKRWGYYHFNHTPDGSI
ncbi:MAG: hypothetical protein ABSH05_22220 [Bryobacteraceae bacterium]